MPTRPAHADDMSKHSGESSHGHKNNLRNRFEVLKTLGQGTYGKVKLAIDKLTRNEVAIKYIKKNKIQNENDLTRIRREIDIMSNLHHPHIIKVYEVFENKEKIILVMEYASGGELYDYINERQGLDEEEARICFRQIVSAVHHLHQIGIVHRDLKLENIVLDEMGDVKIADFGLSNFFSMDAALETFCGSPLYASPEIINGLPYCGPEVDCWSLGVLLYAIVYGAMPFDGSDFKKLRNQITAGKYFEPENPSESAGLLKSILTVDPDKRAGITEICNHWWVNKGFKHTPEDAHKLSLMKEMDSTEEVLPAPSDSDSEPECVPQTVLKKGILKNAITEHIQETVTADEGEDCLPPEFSRHHRESGIESGASGEELDQDSLEESEGESDPVMESVSTSCSGNPNKETYNTELSRGTCSIEPDRGKTEHREDIPTPSKTLENSDNTRVPNTVFDSNKKPVRGILKNKNRQKYRGSDSGCVIVNAPDNSKTDPVNNLQRETSLEDSYDLTDIEKVLDDIEGPAQPQKHIDHYPSLGKYVQYSEYTSTTLSNTPEGGLVAGVKRRKGILKKHSKYSSDYDPTKRYSYGSQGSNSSGDILDFSYDSLDEDAPHSTRKNEEHASPVLNSCLDGDHSCPDVFEYVDREVKFGADFDRDILDEYCRESYDCDDEIISKIKKLETENYVSKASAVTDNSEIFDYEEVRLVYEQAVKYCSDN